MSEKVFAENAPKYWASGLSVIPLRPRHKAPVPNGWQNFCSVMPEKDTQEAWLRMYPDGNVGLPLGPCSGLVAIDLDTDDPKITALIERLIPPTPWVRRGAKGAVYLYRSPANAEHRTFRIKTLEGKSLVECLAKGTQIVLPPSIHPDTQKPYTATAFLPDVLSQLPPLTRDIETIIRGGLTEEGITLSTRGSAKMTEWVASGNRDSSMVSIAGILARAVIRGERTLAEAFGEMGTWISNFTEKVAGDSLDPQKAQMKIVEFVKRDIFEGKKRLPSGWDKGLSEAERAHAFSEFGDDAEKWSVERCMDFLDDAFEAYDRKSGGRRKAIDEVLVQIAKSSMSQLEAEAILQHIHLCSGKTITLASMRNRIKDLQKGEIVGTDHTEIAGGLLKEVSRFGEVRRESGQFWQWGGSHWQKLSDEQLLETTAREFGSLPAARKYSDHRGILRVAENLVPKCLKESALEGINFANGYLTVDLQLHPHKPEYGCTHVLPYRYDASLSAAPRRFFSFLFHSWGDDEDFEDKVKALREAIAATMFGQAWRLQRAICLFGVPESGKSVLKDIVLGLMPDHSISVVPPHSWHDKFLPAQMDRKLINYCGELSESQLIDGASFKSIVDGNHIEAQHKNRPIFRFPTTCAQWFNSNHIPRSRDSSGGFSRRWLFLTFNKPVRPEERVVGLAFQILSEEREAIAAWAVGAMQELLLNNGYTIPKSCLAMTNEMGGLNNSVRYFLKESGKVSFSKKDGKVARCSEQELHEVYWMFCRTVSHDQGVSLKIFRARMAEMQKEFGFRILVECGPSGAERTSYEGIALAA